MNQGEVSSVKKELFNLFRSQGLDQDLKVNSR